MKLKNKNILIILFSFLLLFLISTQVFAADPCIVESYDNLYEYKPVTNDEIEKREKEILKDDRVISEEYYYFIFYHTGAHSYYTVLIEKQYIDYINLVPYVHISDFYQSNENYQEFNLIFGTNDIGAHVIAPYGIGMKNGFYRVILSGAYNEKDKVFTFPMATNYTKPIKYNCTNGDQKDFSLALTQMSKTLLKAEPTQVMKEIVTLLAPVIIFLVALIALKKGLAFLMTLRKM